MYIREKKSKSQLFFDLLESGAGNKLGKSERTIRSYYKFFAGEKLGKNDRKPTKEFIDSLQEKSVKNKVRIYEPKPIINPEYDGEEPEETEVEEKRNPKLYKSIDKKIDRLFLDSAENGIEIRYQIEIVDTKKSHKTRGKKFKFESETKWYYDFIPTNDPDGFTHERVKEIVETRLDNSLNLGQKSGLIIRLVQIKFNVK